MKLKRRNTGDKYGGIEIKVVCAQVINDQIDSFLMNQTTTLKDVMNHTPQELEIKPGDTIVVEHKTEE